MAENYYLVEQNKDYVYVIVVDDNTYTLKRTHSGTWTEQAKGVAVITIVDDGDGITIKFDKAKPSKMDYAKQRELQLLLTFIQLHSPVDDSLTIHGPVPYCIEL